MTRLTRFAASGVTVGVLGAAGTAAAQTPPVPAPGFDARSDGPPPPPGGFRPGREGGPMHPHLPPPRGARFHVHGNRGETRVDVRRAENEPMRACVDAANALLDKSGVQARQGGTAWSRRCRGDRGGRGATGAKPRHGRRSCRRAGPLRSEHDPGICAWDVGLLDDSTGFGSTAHVIGAVR